MNRDEPESCFDLPMTRGPEILAILTEMDPIPGDDKWYPERVDNFCQIFLFRRVTNEITLEFLNVAIERMFTIDEISDIVSGRVLQSLQFKICSLFLS